MELFLKYRKPLYLLVTIYSGVSYFYNHNLLTTSNIICGFTLIDTIYNKDINTKPEYLLHHFLVLTSYGTYQYYKYNNFLDITIKPLLSFQVSSIFLSINELYKKNYYYNKYKIINLILFLSSFVYYRIYLYYYIIVSPQFYLFLNEYNKGLIIIPYSYFLLNMYWFTEIIQKIVKHI